MGEVAELAVPGRCDRLHAGIEADSDVIRAVAVVAERDADAHLTRAHEDLGERVNLAEPTAGWCRVDVQHGADRARSLERALDVREHPRRESGSRAVELADQVDVADDLGAELGHELGDVLEVADLQRLRPAEAVGDGARLRGAVVDAAALDVVDAPDHVVELRARADLPHAGRPAPRREPLALEADEQIDAIGDALSHGEGGIGVIRERAREIGGHEARLVGEEVLGPIARAMLREAVMREAALDRTIDDGHELTPGVPAELAAVTTVVAEPRHRTIVSAHGRASHCLEPPRLLDGRLLGEDARSMSVVSLQGSDLRQAVLSGRMPRDAVVPLLTKLAFALEAARRHRQARPKLRPRNIRIDQFGDPLQLEGSLLPPPPEPHEGPSDERGDVFSLGVTGLFVLHGRDLPLDLFSRLEGFVAELPCDPALGAVLRRACAWDPDARFATLRAFHDALAAAAPDRETHPAVGRLTSPDGIDACQLLIRQDPTRLDPYFALFARYRDAGEIDKAWCVAAALAFFDRAEGEILDLHEAHRQKGPIRPRNTLDEERWVNDLFHPGEDLLLGRLFDAITSAVVRLRVRPDKHFGLKKEQQVEDVESSTVMIARSFGFVSRVLGLPSVPRIFLCSDREGGFAYATTSPLASVCGKGVLSGLNPLDATYLVAKHLSYYRGEHYLRTLFRTTHDAEVLLAAAKRLAGIEVEADDVVAEWVREIDPLLGDEHRAHLRALGERLAQSARRTDVPQWLGAVEVTSARAGFLLCGDLGVAARLVAADPMTRAAGLGAEEVIRELLLFSVSEQFFRLRAHLGIQVVS